MKEASRLLATPDITVFYDDEEPYQLYILKSTR